MKVGMRIIKSAVGAGLAVGIAEVCQLSFGATAAVITVLCIEKTKRRSIRVAFSRLCACLLGLLGAGVVFEWVGYTPYSLTLFLLLFVPILVALKIQEGFVTSVVVVLHLYKLKEWNGSILLDEILVVLIGIGVAMLMNSFMPKLEKKLQNCQTSIESDFRTILHQFAVYLENGDQGWDGRELLQLEKTLQQASAVALQDAGNHLFEEKRDYYHYFEMREQQYDILLRMMTVLPLIRGSEDASENRHVDTKLFADFLHVLGDHVKSENTAVVYRKDLSVIAEKMTRSPLPATQAEFEARARVFQLMNEMDHYLAIKIRYYKEKDICLA